MDEYLIKLKNKVISKVHCCSTPQHINSQGNFE